MKKVIVFGATGSVGQHLVQQALAEGHAVSTFSRSAAKLEHLQHPHLTKLEGDVFDQEAVDAAIKDQDVVFVTLGSGKKRKGTVRSTGTKSIIQAMKKHGIKRLICQTTLGTGDSRGNLNFFWKYIMFGWFLKEVYIDHELQEKYVRESGLDWTIVRPGAFTDGEKTGAYQHGFSGQKKGLTLKISRSDIADFILKEMATGRYLLKSPGLSY